MIKKLGEEEFEAFWKEFGTSIKLGLIEDYSNRTRLAKLLRFESSQDEEKVTSLADYVERMKKGQEHIFFMAASSRKEAETSPFVERLLKRGYEVLYLTQPVDEYAVQSLPEFDGHKFQNVAKEGLDLGDDSEAAKEAKQQLEKEFEPLTKYLGSVLSESIDKAVISDRLSESPCALVASQFGWSGNMERIMKAQAYSKGDEGGSFYANQKKTLEINPRHPLIKNMLERARNEEDRGEDDEDVDATLADTASVLLDTARLRSGYGLDDSVAFAKRIERMLRVSAGVDLDAEVEPEPEYPEDEVEEDAEGEEEEEEEVEVDMDMEVEDAGDDLEGESGSHDEL
jgi:heat shock protein beta